LRSANADRRRDVFTIKDRAIAPHKARFEEALRRLPAAHVTAQAEAITHLHEAAHNAAENAGLPTEPIHTFWRNGTAHVGIDDSTAGDKLFDHEYGNLEQGPQHVLRSAVKAVRPAAQLQYRLALRRELGI
jgi:hypothetical protein